MPLRQQQNMILSEERLNVLRDLALIDSDSETIYDRITVLTSKIIGTPVSLISMVAADYQFFKSYVGLPDPWASERRTPLSHSFCQHVVAENQPLIVNDARKHPLVYDNLAIPDLNVIGYLGMPLTLQDGRRLGSFCVIDSNPHPWSELEIEIVRELSLIVTYEIDLKAMARVDNTYAGQLRKAHEQIEAFIRSVDTENINQTDFLNKVRAARQQYFTL